MTEPESDYPPVPHALYTEVLVERETLRAERDQLRGEVAIARGLLDRYKVVVGPLGPLEAKSRYLGSKAAAGSATPDGDDHE